MYYMLFQRIPKESLKTVAYALFLISILFQAKVSIPVYLGSSQGTWSIQVAVLDPFQAAVISYKPYSEIGMPALNMFPKLFVKVWYQDKSLNLSMLQEYKLLKLNKFEFESNILMNTLLSCFFKDFIYYFYPKLSFHGVIVL